MKAINWHKWLSGLPKIDMSTAAAAAKSHQSCPTLCDLRDGSPPGSPVLGIFLARTLEWVAISPRFLPKKTARMAKWRTGIRRGKHLAREQTEKKIKIKVR